MKSKVVMVDDTPANLEVFRAFLECEDYELHAISDSSLALEYIKKERPDVILLDVMMPQVCGFTLCEQIRRSKDVCHVPVLMITAYGENAAIIRGLNAGADDFLVKPVGAEMLRARIKTITRLNRYRLLCEREQNFRNLFERLPEPILVLDKTGKVVSANSKAESVFAPGPEGSLVGGGIDELFSPQDAGKLMLVVADPRRLSGQVDVAVTKGPDGQRHVRHFQTSSTQIVHGEESHVLICFSDITTQQAAQQAVAELNVRLETLVHERTRQLVEANEMLVSYAEFVAHDLKTPLFAAKGYLSLLQMQQDLDAQKMALYLSRANESMAMMEEMLRSILKLAKDTHAGQGGLGLMNPRPIIQELGWKIAALYPGRNYKFSVGELPAVNASPTLVERVFYNLLYNAFKYTSGCEHPVIEVGAGEAGGRHILFVKDNGVGFGKSEAEMLFKRFSRGESASVFSGSGLGLSLVADLLRPANGRIWAEGTPGAGATFYVDFGSA